MVHPYPHPLFLLAGLCVGIVLRREGRKKEKREGDQRYCERERGRERESREDSWGKRGGGGGGEK